MDKCKFILVGERSFLLPWLYSASLLLHELIQTTKRKKKSLFSYDFEAKKLQCDVPLLPSPLKSQLMYYHCYSYSNIKSSAWKTNCIEWPIWESSLTANFKESEIKEITFYCGCSWLFVQWVVTESNFHISHFPCKELILWFHLRWSDSSVVLLTYYEKCLLNHQPYRG